MQVSTILTMNRRRDEEDDCNDFIMETELLSMITDEYNPNSVKDKEVAEAKKLAASIRGSNTTGSRPPDQDSHTNHHPHDNDTLKNLCSAKLSNNDNNISKNSRIGAVPIRGPGASEETKEEEDEEFDDGFTMSSRDSESHIYPTTAAGAVSELPPFFEENESNFKDNYNSNKNSSQKMDRKDLADDNNEAVIVRDEENLINAYVVQDDPVVVAINAELITNDTEADRIKNKELEERLRKLDGESKIREKRKCINRVVIGSLIIIIVIVVLVTVYYSTKKDETSINDNSNSTFKAFTSTDELYEAVDSILYKRNPETSIEARTYGYPMGEWDVSQITNFSRLFDANGRASVFNVLNVNTVSTFNEDISNWNVSSATTMYGMFMSSVKFNQDLSKWDTSRVTDMSGMFAQSWAFNQDLSKWNISQVKNTSHMFFAAMNFTSDVSNWDTQHVTDMSYMFSGSCKLPRTARYNRWNTSSVTKMKGMFSHAELWDSPDLGTWDVSNVQDMSEMFANASSFQSSDIGLWDVSKVQDMSQMFQNATSFNHDVSKWNVTSVQQMDMMFQDASVFDQNLCYWALYLSSISNSTSTTSSIFVANATNMFVNTACTNQSDPILVYNDVAATTSWCTPCPPMGWILD